MVAARECVNLQQSLVPSIADWVSCLYPNIYWILENWFFRQFLGKNDSRVVPTRKSCWQWRHRACDLLFDILTHPISVHAFLCHCNLEFSHYSGYWKFFFCVIQAEKYAGLIAATVTNWHLSRDPMKYSTNNFFNFYNH